VAVPWRRRRESLVAVPWRRRREGLVAVPVGRTRPACNTEVPEWERLRQSTWPMERESIRWWSTATAVVTVVAVAAARLSPMAEAETKHNSTSPGHTTSSPTQTTSPVPVVK
jgi:hypothetical protein